jgi:hypothetical protein
MMQLKFRQSSASVPRYRLSGKDGLGVPAPVSSGPLRALYNFPDKYDYWDGKIGGCFHAGKSS